MSNQRRVKLKNKRLSKHLEVADFAKSLGISKSYYYLIEAGDRNPSYPLMIKIADKLGVKPDYLFFGN